MFFDKPSQSRTDLACESVTAAVLPSGVSIREEKRAGFTVSTARIETEEASALIGKPIGIYRTVFTGKPQALSRTDRSALVGLIAELVAEAVASATDGVSARRLTLLVAGIGNRRLTADAIGPLAADKVSVTRDLKYRSPPLFFSLGCADVSAVSPDVAAETGIEAADTVRSAAATVGADAIILIDALAARSYSRLISTVQITDTGLAPGSGIGNRRKPIDKNEMGVPVVSVGVPTVVESSTLVREVLSECGIDPYSLGEKLNGMLSGGKSFFVSPEDADNAVDYMSSLIAEAIDTFSGAARS